MKRALIATMLAGSAALFAPSSHAAGVYDGIWTINTLSGVPMGYLSVHESNGAFLVVAMDTTWVWSAMQGRRTSSTAFDVTTVADPFVYARMEGYFPSSTTFMARLDSCQPLSPAHYCEYPNGMWFTGRKIF